MKIIFNYRKGGRVGVPWTKVQLMYTLDGKTGIVTFDFSDKNTETAMNFYRKLDDYIIEVTGSNVLCHIHVLNHQHIEKI